MRRAGGALRQLGTDVVLLGLLAVESGGHALVAVDLPNWAVDLPNWGHSGLCNRFGVESANARRCGEEAIEAATTLGARVGGDALPLSCKAPADVEHEARGERGEPQVELAARAGSGLSQLELCQLDRWLDATLVGWPIARMDDDLLELAHEVPPEVSSCTPANLPPCSLQLIGDGVARSRSCVVE